MAPPNLIQGTFEMGLRLHQQGRLPEAARAYAEVLRFSPQHFDALHLLGVISSQTGQYGQAVELIGKALAVNPKAASAWSNRGIALGELGRLAEAAEDFSKAVRLQPDLTDAWFNRGNIQRQRDEPAMALTNYDKAVQLQPGHAEAWCNRGIVLRDLKRFAEALESFDKALALQPRYAEAWSNRGMALQDAGRIDEAAASYDKALALKPDYAEAHFHKGCVDLLRGDLLPGWHDYEWRKKKEESAGNRDYSQPELTRLEDAAGKTVLVHWEQGLGDTLMFCRFLPLLTQADAKVVFAPQPPLRALLQGLGVPLDDADHPASPFDLHCPLLSLPGICGTTLATIPAPGAYLAAQPDRIAHWRDRIGTHGFKIGIAWQGNVANRHGAPRNFPLGSFAGVARLPGVRLISLHRQVDAAALAAQAPGLVVETLGADFDAGPGAFLDTAAVMKGLDLVITSDTSIAHLAGALGVPTWVALRYVPEWRWLLGRDDSPWYPSLRLFRQQSLGDWDGVFGAVETALAERLTA